MYRYLVPFVSTPENVARFMLKLAEVRPGEIVYDLGSGDGRILIIAAKEFGAKCVGIEIRKDLVQEAIKRVKALGLENQIKIIHGDFFEISISEADVVTMYLLTSVNERLRPKLEKELRPGTRVVSHDFEIPGWTPIKVIELNEDWRNHKIYLYKVQK